MEIQRVFNSTRECLMALPVDTLLFFTHHISSSKFFLIKFIKIVSRLLHLFPYLWVFDLDDCFFSRFTSLFRCLVSFFINICNIQSLSSNYYFVEYHQSTSRPLLVLLIWSLTNFPPYSLCSLANQWLNLSSNATDYPMFQLSKLQNRGHSLFFSFVSEIIFFGCSQFSPKPVAFF